MCVDYHVLSPYRRTYAQCCNICYPLFLFIILAACVMACAGLVWMQIALKEDLDALKEKMQSSKAAVSHNHLVTVIESLIILHFIFGNSGIQPEGIVERNPKTERGSEKQREKVG